MGKGFEDLEVYQEARRFRKRIWKLAKLLPPDEKYVLVSQMKRASLSVTNCIAEGHGSRSYRHNRSYLYRARGSVCELQDDLNTCEDEGCFEKKHLDDLREHSVVVAKLINGYIGYLNGKTVEEGNRPRRTGHGRATSQPVNQSTSQPVNQSTSEPVNQ